MIFLLSTFPVGPLLLKNERSNSILCLPLIDMVVFFFFWKAKKKTIQKEEGRRGHEE